MRPTKMLQSVIQRESGRGSLLNSSGYRKAKSNGIHHDESQLIN